MQTKLKEKNMKGKMVSSIRETIIVHLDICGDKTQIKIHRRHNQWILKSNDTIITNTKETFYESY